MNNMTTFKLYAYGTPSSFVPSTINASNNSNNSNNSNRELFPGLNYINYFPRDEPQLPPLPDPDTLNAGDYFICIENNIVDDTSGETYYAGDLALVVENENGQKEYIKINRQGGGLTREEADALYVPLKGDTTITGHLYTDLTIDGDPNNTLTTKSYVDDKNSEQDQNIDNLNQQVSQDIDNLNQKISQNTTEIEGKINRSGDTMSGSLNIPNSAIVSSLSAVNRDYVDGSISVVAGGLVFKGLFSTTAPLPSPLGQENGYYYIATEDTTDQPSRVTPNTDYKGGDLAVINNEEYVKVDRQGSGIIQEDADSRYLSKIENTSTNFLVECTAEQGLFTDNTLVTKKYVDDVDVTKQDVITGAATTILDDDLATEKVVISNSNGKIDVSGISTTQLDTLSGIAGNIQDQFDNLDGNVSNLETIVNNNSQQIQINQQEIQNNKDAITNINTVTIPGLQTNINNNSQGISDNADSITNLNNTKVDRSGDIMQGTLSILDSQIINSQSAVNKGYVDTAIDSIAGGLKFIDTFDTSNLPPSPPTQPSGSFYIATETVTFDGEQYLSGDISVVVDDGLGNLSYAKIDRQGTLTETQADLKYLFKIGDICTGKLQSQQTLGGDSDATLTTKKYVDDADTNLENQINTNTGNISGNSNDISDINDKIDNLPPASFPGSEDHSNYITNWDSLQGKWVVDTNKVKAGKNSGIRDTTTNKNVFIGEVYNNTAELPTTTGNQNTVIGNEVLGTSNEIGNKNVIIGANIQPTKLGSNTIVLGENFTTSGEVGDNTIIMGSNISNTNSIASDNIIIGKDNFPNGITTTNNVVLGTLIQPTEELVKPNNLMIGTAITMENGTAGRNLVIGTELSGRQKESVCIGHFNEVSNNTVEANGLIRSTTVGFRNINQANSGFSTVVGSESQNNGDESVVVGYNCENTSGNSTVIGSSNKNESKEAVILGYSGNNSGEASVIVGRSIINSGYGANCVGRYISCVSNNTNVINATDSNIGSTEEGNTYIAPLKENAGSGTGNNGDRGPSMKLMTYNTSTKQVKYANKAWLNDVNSNTSSINSLNTNFKYPRLSLGRPFKYVDNPNGTDSNPPGSFPGAGEFTFGNGYYWFSFRDLNNFGFHNGGKDFTGGLECSLTFCVLTGNPYLVAGYKVTDMRRSGSDSTGNYRLRIQRTDPILSSSQEPLSVNTLYYCKCSLFF